MIILNVFFSLVFIEFVWFNFNDVDAPFFPGFTWYTSSFMLPTQLSCFSKGGVRELRTCLSNHFLLLSKSSDCSVLNSELRNFMFVTGIECSYPTIDNGKTRRDQLDECGYYKYWKEDLHQVKELGLNVLRYGLPYYSIHQSYDKFDWSFADEVMYEIKRLGIVPILDLMHFGEPDWIENFQNPELPYQFYRYAAAVVERYPWARFYTPVNEILLQHEPVPKTVFGTTKKGDRSFVTAMKNIEAASIMATHRLVKNRPDAVIIQSETAEVLHETIVSKSKDVNFSQKASVFVAGSSIQPSSGFTCVCMHR